MKSGTPRILFAASEVFPWVKTGGLADASGALPPALLKLGYDVRLVLPGYRSVLEQIRGARVCGELDLDGTDPQPRLLQTRIPGADVPAYVLDAPESFDRPGGPYQDTAGNDWPDNAQRFALFCRVIERIGLDRAGIDWQPDVLHCNDWHTGLAPALLHRQARRPRTLFAIHSLAYQGNFPYETFTSLHLPRKFWSPESLEFQGRMSFIKGGLVYADRLVTVSATYAREIITPEYGCGLDGLLKHRKERLSGILNGVDYQVWDPRRDPHIAQPFWIDRLAGKLDNKRRLQTELGLEIRGDAILLAHIARLTYQKGSDLIIAALPGWLAANDLQLVVLGTGEATFEAALRQAAASNPGRVAVRIGYDEALAHRIQAGSDILLMPSRFEPCGLTQLYSLRYGTVPIVRATGGLADTIVGAGASSLDDGTATGFRFQDADTRPLLHAVSRAVELRRSGLGSWRRLQRTGMKQNFSWARSAREYAAVYSDLLAEAHS